MKENEYAYYAHYFLHQLQLALVAVAKNHIQIVTLFNLVANIVNVVAASCKWRDILREKQATKVIELLDNRELSSGFIDMLSSVVDVLDIVSKDGINAEQIEKTNVLLDLLQSFEFVFNLYLKRTILGITNELSHALQRKDQDIVNVMTLVQVSNQRLQMMRKSGWSCFLDDVTSFCEKYEIVVPKMDDIFIAQGMSKRTQENTKLHRYQVELFYTVIDMQLQELNSRFTKLNTNLLLCVTCLSPSDSFLAFDKEKLVHLVQFYPKEFSSQEFMILSDQLDSYIIDMRFSIEFSNLLGIGDLAQKMVETKKHVVYPLIYLLVTLVLILPVVTATVERTFSAMKIVKNRLRNQIGD